MSIVAVYGSAMPKPGEAVYEETRRVGYALAKAGYAVMTGGYNGLMAAASQGAAEAGGHVIGVACLALERARGVRINPWVNDVISCETMMERLTVLVSQPSAFVTMPGGLGTLNELVYTSELMRAGDIPRRPIVCYGDFWENIVQDPNVGQYMHSSGWGDLRFAHLPEQVVEVLHGGG